MEKPKPVFICLVLLCMAVLTISPAQAATDEEIQESTTDGTQWLADQQNPDGSWGSTDQIGSTDFAVLKLETHAVENGVSPFDPSYQYSDEVQDGLDYLFLQAKTVDLTVQPDGNPDTNGDGIGVYFGSSINDYHVIYQTGITLATICAGESPDRVVNVPGSVVNGQTYGTVAQNIVDFLAWAQTDSGTYDGGWYYIPNSGYSDNSVSGYATLGLVYASSPTIGFSCTIPDFVKTELNKWVTYIQSPTTGGSGYTSPGDYYANVYNTGNLLVEFALLGDSPTTPRVQAAINFLVNNWNAPGSGYSDIGWRESSPSDIVNYIATYSIMKALQTFNLDTIGGIDWYQDFANAILPEQLPDGSWPVSKWASNTVLSTCWALLTLEKAAPPAKVADLYVNTIPSTQNPQVGQNVLITFKVGNRGPDPALDTVFTWIIPEGMEYIGATVDDPATIFNYDPTTRTLTWTLGTVPITDPSLFATVLIQRTGIINIQPMLETSTADPELENNIGTSFVEARAAGSTSTVSTVTAGTVGMLETGTTLAGIALAILMVMGGMVSARRK